MEGEKTAAPGRRSVTLPGSGEEESTGPSSGTSSSSSLSVRPTRRLLRVMVVDYPTGIALFHHTWAWKGDPNVAGIAKVIVAFYKLSQSLGGRGGTFFTPSFHMWGGVFTLRESSDFIIFHCFTSPDTNYVLFDPPPEGRRRSQQDLYSIKSKRASGGAGLRVRTPRYTRIILVFAIIALCSRCVCVPLSALPVRSLSLPCALVVLAVLSRFLNDVLPVSCGSQ